MKNKKILFCITSMEKGGAERVVANLANELSDDNEVYVGTIVNKEVMYSLNKNVHYFSVAKEQKKKLNKLLKLILFPFKLVLRVCNLKKMINKIKPDIIISFLPEASFFTVVANKKKYKLIISDRNDPNQEYKKFLYRFLMKKTYPKADGFVFQTLNAKEYFDNIIDFTKKDYSIIVNPVNPNFIIDRFEGKRKKEIVSVGRLQEQKNYALLIEAFNDIKDDLKGYKLVIYGEGNQRNCLEKIIADNDLKNIVSLPGVVDDVKEKIYDSSLFVMTSNYEGIPNSLVEAMTLGLTVISTDCPCGGPRMFIEDGKNGNLIEVGNKEQLKEKILKCVRDNNYSDECGRKAQKIVKMVEGSVVTKEWKKIISKVIGD